MILRFSLYVSALAIASAAVHQDKAAPTPPAKPKDGNELPIKPTRKIEFTTEEVTWPSLDISPDTKSIVFELLGDIYTMPMEGGDAKLLIGGNSYDGMPKFSPDGKKIVFISDRSGADNVWMCNADGTELKAVSTGRNTAWLSPTFTPDGNYVIASKGAGYLPSYNFQMFDIRGGGGFGLGPGSLLPGTLNDVRVGRPTPNRMGITNSPDGKYFFFTERKGAWQYNEDNGGQTQVFRMDRSNGKIENVTNEDGGAMRPLVSPDGKTLLYFTRSRNKTGLKALDFETGNRRWVAYPVDRDDMESRSTRDLMPGYAFTPDGNSVIMGLHGKIQKVDITTGDATVIPFKAQVSQMIGEEVHFDYKVDESPMIKSKIIRDTVISPDGSTVVFCAFQRLWSMDIKEQKPKRLTNSNANEYNPSFAPDGKSIVYCTWDQAKGGEVDVVAPDGGEVKTLTSYRAFYSNAIFTPDGKNVIYTTGTTEQGLDTAIRQQEPQQDELEPQELGRGERFLPQYLKMIPAGGGPVKLLMQSPGAYYFLQDPEKLYVTHGPDVVSMKLDGSDTHEIVRFTGATPQSGANGVTLSPDGSKALVDVDFKLYTSTLPQTGEVVNLSTAGGAVPVKKLTQDGGKDAQWTADGKSIYWTLGNKLYIQAVDADKPTEIPITVEVPRATPQGKVVLKGARLITLKGDQVIPSGDVLIENNRILKIGPSGSFPIPKDAKVMAMKGKTISPGYVDTHSHWFGSVQTAYPMSWAYLTDLAYGVTTQRDPQSGGDGIYDFADAINAGMAPGPRIYTTGPGIVQGSGTEDKEAIYSHLKRYRDAYDTKTIKEYVTGDRLTIEQVAMACKEYGLTPTTEGALEIKRYLAEAMSGISGHEHGFPIALYDDVAQFVAKTHTYYTPTLIVSYGGAFGENYWFTNYNIVGEEKVNRFTPARALDGLIRRRDYWGLPEEYVFPMVAAGAKKVVDAGGKVCVGCHGEFQGLGSHWEMWMLASGGMTPLQVLRCASLNGAEAIGLSKDLGSLETGKFADMVIYDKNPLEDIHNTNTIHWVMKNGELFDTHTMDSVYPVAKKLGPLYWDSLKPPTEKK